MKSVGQRPPEPLLAVDIGAGTRDILVALPGGPAENQPQFVIPSRTSLLAEEVRALTAAGLPLHLTGRLMGGGPLSSAVRKHLAAGLAVSAGEEAARTIRDDLDRVKAMGVVLTEEAPPGSRALFLDDLDVAGLGAMLAAASVQMPERWAVAVQDHGAAPPGMSDRLFRFQQWLAFLQDGGRLDALAHEEPPGHLTRMRAVRAALPPGSIVADTGAAAIWGALSDEAVAGWREEGLTALNVGNQHTLAAVVRGDRVLAVLEHHTVFMDAEKIRRLLDEFIGGRLRNEEVYADKGHGCAYADDFTPSDAFGRVAVTGPRRALCQGLGYAFAAPYGNMMLAGAFGLAALYATLRQR